MAVERRRDDPHAPWNKEHRKAPAKKDTNAWCRGKVGVEHTFEVVKHHSFHVACKWHPWGKWKFSAGIRRWVVYDYRFWCSHYYRCTVCGKYGESIPKEQCPDYSPKPELEDG